MTERVRGPCATRRPSHEDSPDDSKPTIAVIIPTFNEEAFIGATLESAQQNLADFNTEFLIADNGSTDGTRQIAAMRGATILIDEEKSVGGLRNMAAAAATTEILLFLDADVHLTDRWKRRAPEALWRLRQNCRVVTGSTYGVPADATWLERRWFLPLSRRPKTYINSGHLLISRSFFNEIGGFDPKLETGEDYELCGRAFERGGEIAPDPLLVVEHMGFPRTPRAFVSREAWHGLGDFQSLRVMVRSRVALAALAFLFLHAGILSTVFLGRAKMAATAFLAAILALCLVTAGRMLAPIGIREWLAGAGIAYLYLLGRATAAVRSVWPRKGKRHERTV